MIDVIGHRETEKALMLGQMYSTQEALDIGMVDKLVPEADVMSAAQQEIQQWLKIPGTKRTIWRLYSALCTGKLYFYVQSCNYEV